MDLISGSAVIRDVSRILIHLRTNYHKFYRLILWYSILFDKYTEQSI